MKNLRFALTALFPIAMGCAAPASATPAEVTRRAQVDLNGECLMLFLNDKYSLSSPIGYQYYATALLDNVVFAFGEINSKQYCAYARKTIFNSWDDTDKKAIEKCEEVRPQGGARCEVYARDNDIVYVGTREKLKKAMQLFEAGDLLAAKHALIEVKAKNLSKLSVQENAEYEYLLGKVLINSNSSQDKAEAITHFNNAWAGNESKAGYLYAITAFAAVEEGNARILAGDIDKKWLFIRDAYQYFLAHASDQQKSLHPEVEQNLKQTEQYYQAELARKRESAKEQARFDAVRAKELENQAKIDAIQAQQRKKQEQLDAMKAAEDERQQEKVRQAEVKRIAKEGDGSEDDMTCKSFGARPGADGYVNCRVQLQRSKQLIEDQQNAQKAASDAAVQKAASDAAAQQRATNLTGFANAKKCATDTQNPSCINNAGTYALRLGNSGDARDWWTLAARHGNPLAIKNLTNYGFPVPEPDLLRRQHEVKNRDNAAAALLLLLGGVNSYLEGKAAEKSAAPYETRPTDIQPVFKPLPEINCTSDVIGSSVYTKCR